jgi:hypothetical protein
MKHTRSSRFAIDVAAILALAVGLAGCGKGDEETAATATPQPATNQAPDTGAAPPPVEAAEDANMANAVVTGKTAAAVDLKYDVPVKPAVGEPFELELAFLPRLAANTLEVEVTGIPGLTLVSGGTSRFEAVGAGDRHVMRVLVRADAPGLYYVGVAAKMVTKVQSDSRTFSVPVAVGNVQAAQKTAPDVDASGQPVESMPAAESGGTAESKP